MPPPLAILFDLDDTLTDRPQVFPSFRDCFLEHFAEELENLEPEVLLELLVAADGKGYSQSRSADICRLLPWRRTPTEDAITAFWREQFPRMTVPREGLFETLHALSSRGIRLGVVTNGPSQVQNCKLNVLGVRSQMDVIVISEEVGIAKPDPRIFEYALGALGSRPEDTWFVGDHPENDVLGAGAVGMTPVWVRDRHSWPIGAPPPERHIGSLMELLDLLEPEPDLVR